ncbi:MAG: hypothetical protein HYZ44_06170 [Bacteroidetes bacterium]|nr:hypothetical protein [Bacteroidota bacterium]
MENTNTNQPTENIQVNPIKFPTDFNPTDNESKLAELFRNELLAKQINDTTSIASRSIRWAAFIIIISLAAMVAMAFVSRKSEMPPAQEYFCCNNKLTYTGGFSMYDYSIYGFIALSIFGVGIGWVLVQNYVSATKKVASLIDQYEMTRSLQVAWEMSKGLADWSESVPKSEVIDQKTTEIDSKSPDSSKVVDGKTVNKGVEYTYPRQRAQQQIIETILSKIGR